MNWGGRYWAQISYLLKLTSTGTWRREKGEVDREVMNLE